MPGMDGTGPMGYGSMTGGRRGWCATGAPGAVRGAGMGRGRGGGYGRRNQFYATGLTGWERAAQAETAPVGAGQAEAAPAPGDPLVRIEKALGDVLARLDRLEAAGQS